MEKKENIMSQNKKLFLILSALGGLGELLLIIGMFLVPLSSIGEGILKIDMKFMDWMEEDALIILGAFFLIFATLPQLVIIYFVQNDTWKEKIKLMIVAVVVECILAVIGYIIFVSSITFIETEEYPYYIETNIEIGAILVVLGVIFIICADVIKVWALYCFAEGKAPFVKEDGEVINNTSPNSLEKLEELKLKGLISEEEYQEKRKEIIEKI